MWKVTGQWLVPDVMTHELYNCLNAESDHWFILLSILYSDSSFGGSEAVPTTLYFLNGEARD